MLGPFQLSLCVHRGSHILLYSSYSRLSCCFPLVDNFIYTHILITQPRIRICQRFTLGIVPESSENSQRRGLEPEVCENTLSERESVMEAPMSFAWIVWR